MTTILEGDKQLEKREYQGQNWLEGLCWSGYEIHLGRSVISGNVLESIVKNDASLGVIDRKQKIIGTYIHGWLESPEVTGVFWPWFLQNLLTSHFLFKRLRNLKWKSWQIFWKNIVMWNQFSGIKISLFLVRTS